MNTDREIMDCETNDAFSCSLFPKRFQSLDYMEALSNSIQFLKSSVEALDSIDRGDGSNNLGLYFLLDTLEASVSNAGKHLAKNEKLMVEQSQKIDSQQSLIEERQSNNRLSRELVEKAIKIAG